MSTLTDRLQTAIRERYAARVIRERYAQGVHAPKGGVHIAGKEFRGGEFIPGDVVEEATPDERAALTKTRPGFEAVSKAGGKPAERRWVHADESGDLPPEIAERAKALKIPPGLSGVQIASDPASPLQAIGYDAKGRQKRIYSVAATSENAAAKWRRVSEFMQPGAGLDRFRKKAADDIKGPDGPDKEAALVLYFQDKTGIRVGTGRETGGKVKAYGASTLEAQHVTVDGTTVTFDFIGKEGVRNQGTVKDAALAALLAPRIAKGGKLFDVSYGKITRYFKSATGGDFKVKDLRTVTAAETALSAIKKIPRPTNEKEFQQRRRQVGVIVAAKLNHVAKLDKKTGELRRSPDMALNNYIPPEVFSEWQAKLLTSSGPASKTSASSPTTSATPAKSAKTPTQKATTPKQTKSDMTSRFRDAFNAARNAR